MTYGEKFEGPKKATSVSRDLKKLMQKADEAIASVIDIPEATGKVRKDLDIDDNPEQSLIENIKGYAGAINQPAIVRNLGEVKRLLQEMRVTIITKDSSNLPDPFEAEPDESATPLHAFIKTLEEQFTSRGHDLKNGKGLTNELIADLIKKCRQIDDLSQEIAQGLKEKGVGRRARE